MFKSCVGFIFFLSFVGPVVLGPPEKKEICEKHFFYDCLKRLQTFLSITPLLFTSDQEKLDLLCDKGISGYMCSVLIHTNADCLLKKDVDLIHVFLRMSEYLQIMFCEYGNNNTGYLREVFLSNSDCLLKHRDKIECCAIATKIQSLPVLEFLQISDRSLEERSATTCCPLSRYIQCVSAVARDHCGKTAPNFITEYIIRAAGEQVHSVCQHLKGYPYTDSITCPDPVKTCSGVIAKQQENVASYFVFAFALIWMSRKQLA